MLKLRLCLTLLASVLLLLIALPVPSRADVVVSTFDNSSVLRYNEATGQALPGGVSSGSGGLSAATGVAFGPDGNIYVSSRNTGQVLRYNGTTGAFMGPDAFATLPSSPQEPQGAPAHLEFYGGDLYVADSGGSSIERFNGQTGEFIGNAANGLFSAGGFTFAPNGDLYASSFAGPQFGQAAVVRVHNGVQSDFVHAFTSPVQTPNGLLYVNNTLLVVDLFGNQVLRYDADGNYLGVFATVPPPPPDPLPPEDQFASNFPSDLAFSRDGKSILLAVLGIDHNSSGTVLKYDLQGNLLSTFATGIPAAASVALSVSATHLPGDFDLDGQVTQADIAAMLNALADLQHYKLAHSFSDANLRSIGDLNHDGAVTNADIQTMLDQLGAGQNSLVGVPEPSGAWLAVFGFVALAIMHQQYRSRLRMFASVSS